MRTIRADAGGEVGYPHGDLVGSTMMRVNAAGQAATAVAYTAFGEPISAGVNGVPNVQGDPDWAELGSIYRYCGEWNYQTGSLPASVPAFDSYEYPVADDLIGLRTTNPTLPPIILTHVGYRWYDAGIGRFVQRDPIGLGGGVNLYAYVGNKPTCALDPLGLVADTELCPECGRLHCMNCHTIPEPGSRPPQGVIVGADWDTPGGGPSASFGIGCDRDRGFFWWHYFGSCVNLGYAHAGGGLFRERYWDDTEWSDPTPLGEGSSGPIEGFAGDGWGGIGIDLGPVVGGAYWE